MKRAFKRISLPKPAVSSGERDSSIALINVVFLLLVFLLVAGSFRPSIPDGFEWTETRSELGRGVIEGHIVLDGAGKVWNRGEEVTLEELAELLGNTGDGAGSITVLVDRRAKIGHLSALTDTLRNAGVGAIRIIALEAGAP